ncbi:MAG: diguanylate cyclase [Cyanobacteria bacterium P01_F01_bin.53]
MNAPLVLTNPVGRTPQILIVDDDSLSRFTLDKFLSKDGYQIIAVEGGQEALEVCQKELPDIILMDAMMPVLDGYQCCKRLRAAYPTTCPPILMITGLDDTESVEEAYGVGAIDYVTKPFHWAVLRCRVRQIIKAHHDHQALQKNLAQERLLRQKLDQANQQLFQLATTDPLTALSNRRVFDQKIDNEWKRLRREKGFLGLIFIDIDCFKAYNDTYGHRYGDDCLRQVADILQGCIHRPADIAARFGGEEFALLLPNTDYDGVMHLAKTFRKKLHQKAIPHGSSLAKAWVTASIGVTSIIPSANNSPKMLVDMADKAMYDAKNSGRDCIASCLTPQAVSYCSLTQKILSA